MVVRQDAQVFGEGETAGLVAAHALAAAAEAGDTWAMGWALHVLSLVTTISLAQGSSAVRSGAGGYPADPALTDLRLLLQINKAVTLGNLDQYDGPSPWPGRPGTSPNR